MLKSMELMVRGWLRVAALLAVATSALPVAAQAPAPGSAGSSAAPAPQPAPSEGPVDPWAGASAAAPAPAPPVEVYSDNDPSALTDFRQTLDAYGGWVEDPTYGVVWVPDRRLVGEDFAPYVTRGYWAVDEEGDWVWVSQDPFAWVVYHYGRWVWTSSAGWVWIPGRQYAKAWVVWRTPIDGYGYVGWAPMPPSFIWVDGYATTLRFYPPVPYVFCASAFVFSHSVHHHLVHHPARIRAIASHTRRYTPSGARAAQHPDYASAGIPPRARPTQRVAADPRAVAAARPAAGYRPLAAPARAGGAGRVGVGSSARSLAPAGRSAAPRAAAPAVGPAQRPLQRSVPRAPRPALGQGVPSRPSPRLAPQPRSLPSRPSAPRSAPPQPRPAPRSWTGSSGSHAPSYRSAPSFHGGAGRGPATIAPSRRPSLRPSAPTLAPSPRGRGGRGRP